MGVDKKMKNLVKIIVQEGDIAQRLDLFLIKKFPSYSRSYFQNLIEDNLIKINSKAAPKSSYLLKKQDEIDIEFPPQQPLEIIPQKVDFDIVDTKEDFLIINKPAGLIVHHSQSNKDQITLVHGLLYLFKEFKEFSDTIRPGIIHRLDKDTSGLIIIARNTPSQISLASLFKERIIKKTYYALVSGHPSPQGTINAPIGRHPKERHKMSVHGLEKRESITHYTVLKYFKDTALVELHPITGRTHQIRVHLASIGHGILGDSTYGHKSKLISRQALHAKKSNSNIKISNIHMNVHYQRTCKK